MTKLDIFRSGSLINCAKVFTFIIFGFVWINPAFPSEVNRSWQNALVFSPLAEEAQNIDVITEGYKGPIILYMHGCVGIGSPARQWGRMLANDGFTVVLMDAFSIPDHPNACEGVHKGSNRKLRKIALKNRKAEIRYARAKFHELKILPDEKVILMGQSQGGRAVTRVSARGFAAVISTGFNCKNGKEIETAPDIPVLFVQFDQDEYLVRDGKNCERSGVLQDALRFSQTFEGDAHDPIENSEAVDLIIEFALKYSRVNS